MRIKSVEGVVLAHRVFYERDALAVVGGAEHYMEIVLVKVETADGLLGYGECIAYGGAESVSATVNKILSPLIKGEESSEIRKLWDKMYKSSFRLGRRGVVISAISGIDIALWDLLGKELGAPVYKLLGGEWRRIKGYITGGYYSEQKGVPQLIEEVKGYIDKGFDTVKLKIGGLSVKEDIERIKAVKEHFGDKLDIAVDANNVYDFNTALAVGRQLEKLGVIFFEEPIPTDYPRLSAELASSLDIPIAGYETAYTLYEFRDIISMHGVDIVQVDASWNGGITEMLRIGGLARAYGLPVIPHYSAGGISYLASLHTALAIGSPMIEYHLIPNPLREQLTGNVIKYENGYFTPPTDTGLGAKVDERIITEYRKKEN